MWVSLNILRYVSIYQLLIFKTFNLENITFYNAEKLQINILFKILF